jgi:alginate O-acetyltransferase complex protein AlgI
MAGTFGLITIAWVFFRANSVAHAIGYLKNMFTLDNSINDIIILNNKLIWDWGYSIIILIVIFTTIEWLGRKQNFALESMFNIQSKTIKWGAYLLLFFCICTYTNIEEITFIYFQF